VELVSYSNPCAKQKESNLFSFFLLGLILGINLDLIRARFDGEKARGAGVALVQRVGAEVVNRTWCSVAGSGFDRVKPGQVRLGRETGWAGPWVRGSRPVRVSAQKRNTIFLFLDFEFE
jgi:hypothetical protein